MPGLDVALPSVGKVLPPCSFLHTQSLLKPRKSRSSTWGRCRSQLPSCLKMRRPWCSLSVKTAHLPGKKSSQFSRQCGRSQEWLHGKIQPSVLFLRVFYSDEKKSRAVVTVLPTYCPALSGLCAGAFWARDVASVLRAFDSDHISVLFLPQH